MQALHGLWADNSLACSHQSLQLQQTGTGTEGPVSLPQRAQKGQLQGSPGAQKNKPAVVGRTQAPESQGKILKEIFKVI